VITDIGFQERKFKIEFQAPPTVGSYVFDFHVKCDAYVDADHSQWVYLDIADPSQLEGTVVEEVIPEGDEGMYRLSMWLMGRI